MAAPFVPPDFPLSGRAAPSAGPAPTEATSANAGVAWPAESPLASPAPAPDAGSVRSYPNLGGPDFDPRTGARLDRTLPGIDARSFRDKRDADRLTRVRLLKGLDFVYSRFLDLGVEQAMTLEMTAQAAQISPAQGAALWALLDRAARVLDIRVPDLYLGHLDQSGTAMQTVGHERPFIIADAWQVDPLEDDELVFAFGRELGHILLGHVTYKMLARSIGVIGGMVGTFTLNVGSMVTTGLEAPLRDWDQFSEFSADRAGLLAAQRIDVAVSALFKLAAGGQRFFSGMNLAAFVEQGRRALYSERPAGTRLSAIVRSLQAGAPLLAARAAALTDWYESGDYTAVLHGRYTRRTQVTGNR